MRRGAPGADAGEEPPPSLSPALPAAAAGLPGTIPPNSQLRRERAAAGERAEPERGT